jgi:hypothetical protein
MRVPARIVASAALLLLLIAARHPQAAAVQKPAASPVVIPFELGVRHIVVKVTVNGSRPLSFVLDTGANAAIIRSSVARELKLSLEGEVRAGGAGAGTQTGSLVKNATWAPAGLDGFRQPVTLALPFDDLPGAMGCDIDGIIGGEFIRQFVIGVDYETRQLTVFDRETFRYTGAGQTLPLDFTPDNHPILTAAVTPIGQAPLERRFVLDLGSGGAVILHSPFVKEQGLPGAGVTTVPMVGAAGAGGRTTGAIGRVAALQIGRYKLENVLTAFSNDAAGAMANPALAGNIGAQIASRFRLWLDYGRKRIILEPSATFGNPFDRAFSGVALKAEGADYRVFRVREILDPSPATDAGIRVDDVITAIDQTPARALTLSGLYELFEKPTSYTLTIRRGDQTLTVTLTPRKMV